MSKKSLQCREKFFFCADDLLCQMFDTFVGSRILVQVAVQGFDAHIAAIGDQACDGTVRIVTYGFKIAFHLCHGFRKWCRFFPFVMIAFEISIGLSIQTAVDVTAVF